MAILGTPVHTVLVFHLNDVDLDSLDPWNVGSFVPERSTRPEVMAKRTGFFHDPAPVDDLLSESNRRWIPLDFQLNGVRLMGAEVVRHHTTWTTFGHLVLHLRTTADAHSIEAMKTLALLARADSEPYEAFMDSIPNAPKPEQRRRAAALLLSGVPGEDEWSMVRWRSSTPLERRLASLLTLRQTSVKVPEPFRMDVEGPTPSYRLSASGHTVALIRLTKLEPHRHGDLLRSTWLDSFMLELVQYEALRDLERRVRHLKSDAEWPDMAKEFRLYRVQQLWSAGSDHPLERALARRLRLELGTDAVVDRIQKELDDHVAVAAAAASTRMNVSLFVLAVGALLIPLLVAFDSGEAGWGLAVAGMLSLALTSFLVVAVFRPGVAGRSRRGGTRT